MGMGAFKRLEQSPAGKAVLAVAIFSLIVGGWFGYQHYQTAQAELPGAPTRAEQCALWFVGSSSIHRWTSLDKDMAPWKAYRRGVDDAGYSEILPRFANAADDPRPAAIILYVGENDIARGMPVRVVVRDLAKFLELRTRMMEDVPVLVLSMKPSPGRWKHFRAQQLFNGAAKRLIPHMPRAYYADITSPLLIDGRTGENYRRDGVHMNAAGYRIWADVVRRRLREILPPAVVKRCEAEGMR